LDYHVLLGNLEAAKPPLIAEALAKLHGVPAADMAQAARRSWGFALESASKEKAEALVGHLAAKKLESFVLPANLVEELPARADLPTLSLADPHFEAGGQRRSWSNVSVIAACALTRTVTHTRPGEPESTMADKALKLGLMMSGLPTGLAPKTPQGPVKSSETEFSFHALLVVSEPAAVLHLDCDRFDYSCLGEKMGYNALLNFKALLTELKSRAPKALVNRGFEALRLSAPVAALGYEALADLEKESRWLTTLRALGRA
jgi:hypothetical protein